MSSADPNCYGTRLSQYNTHNALPKIPIGQNAFPLARLTRQHGRENAGTQRAKRPAWTRQFPSGTAISFWDRVALLESARLDWQCGLFLALLRAMDRHGTTETSGRSDLVLVAELIGSVLLLTYGIWQRDSVFIFALRFHLDSVHSQSRHSLPQPGSAKRLSGLPNDRHSHVLFCQRCGSKLPTASERRPSAPAQGQTSVCMNESQHTLLTAGFFMWMTTRMTRFFFNAH
jgi:hypothetical protein